MFERVITQTIQKITTEVLREQPSISLIEILDDERIPTRLKPFFETEVQWWLYNEMLARSANKRFNYDHPELASLLNYLEQVQFRHARFEREDFLTVLDSAVKLTYNFLCRPQTTLKWYIFRGQPVKPLREVMLRFGAFLDYGYFRNVFIEWVERKQHERPTFDGISSTEFERVIRRTDDQILLNCTVEDLLAIINPIFEFIGEGAEMFVPIDALIIFFDDKNIKKLVDYLERCRGEGREMVGREDFVALLDELLSSSEDEPEADFSNVYQNDELDEVVRRHLELEGKVPIIPNADSQQPVSSEEESEGNDEPLPEAPIATASETIQDEERAGDEGSDSTQQEDLGAWISDEDHRSFIEAFGAPGDQAQVEEPANETAAMSDESEDVSSVPHDETASEDIESTEGSQQSDLLEVQSSDEKRISDRVVDVSREQEPTNGTTVISDESDAEEEKPADDLLEEDDDDEEEVALEELAARSMRQQEASRYESQAERKLEDVRRFIDPMLERKVVKRIFNKDRTEYETTLDQLNDSVNWRTASQVLDELFNRHSVDPYSRTAIRFTDSVYGRYLPK